MTNKHCKMCTSIKEYDGKYRCMVCYKEFTVADKEDVMNQVAVAPAIARIQELETENKTLRQKLEALMALSKAVRNPTPQKEGCQRNVGGFNHVD